MIELYDSSGLITKLEKGLRILLQPGERFKLYLPSRMGDKLPRMTEYTVDMILEVGDRCIIMLSEYIAAEPKVKYGGPINGE